MVTSSVTNSQLFSRVRNGRSKTKKPMSRPKCGSSEPHSPPLSHSSTVRHQPTAVEPASSPASTATTITSNRARGAISWR